ncbi:MAG: DUF192 domain-containing protein [Rhodobacteraceae bacterium]|nr:DUF192 domain-containing protein [Paracoccaceae bacterium]
MAVFLTVSFIVSPAGARADCGRDFVDLRWPSGSVRFAVEIADTIDTRAQGLMFRESMPRYNGMLFVYPNPQPVSFWMKNTLIPLDMIFLDQQGKVVRVHENAVPHDRTSIFGGTEVLAVLEINGGLTRRLGLVPGAEMRHPAFAASKAVWPCEDSTN